MDGREDRDPPANETLKRTSAITVNASVVARLASGSNNPLRYGGERMLAAQLCVRERTGITICTKLTRHRAGTWRSWLSRQ